MARRLLEKRLEAALSTDPQRLFLITLAYVYAIISMLTINTTVSTKDGPIDEISLILQKEPFTKIKTVISSIKSTPLKVRASLELAQVLDRIDYSEQAENIWQQAERVSLSLWRSHRDRAALEVLASMLVQANRWEEAERVALLHVRESVFELAMALIQHQRWDQAERIALSMANHRSQALHHLVLALIQHQLWDQAERVFSSMQDDSDRWQTREALVSALSQAQRWEQARRVAFPSALNTLIKALVFAQHIEQAVQLVASLDHQKEWQPSARLSLLAGLAEIGQWEQANHYLASWEPMDERDKSYRQEALRQMAGALARVRAWEQAEEVIKAIDGGWLWTKFLAQQELFNALVEAQRWEHAEHISRAIEDRHWRERTLGKLVLALGQARKWELAERVAYIIQHPFENGFALRRLAVIRAQIGEGWEAERIVRAIADNGERAIGLRKLVEALGRGGCWEQAEQIARSIEEEDWKGWALGKLVRTLALAQRWEQAAQVARSIEEKRSRMLASRKLLYQLERATRRQQVDWMIANREKVKQMAVDLYEGEWSSVWGASVKVTFAHILIREQRWTEAEHLVPTIVVGWLRYQTQRKLIEAMIQAQCWEQVEQFIASTEEEDLRDWGWLQLVVAMLQKEEAVLMAPPKP